MKVGNKSQAVVLSVVAVGAVGFLMVQLKGAAGNAVRKLQDLATGSTVAKSEAPTSSALPKSLFGDPYSHPALPRPEKPKVVGSGTDESNESDTPQRGGSEFGINPWRIDPAMASSVLGTGGTITVEKSDPAPPKPKGPNVTLQAIVMAQAPMAFLSLDGGEPARFAVGDSPTEGVRILAIREGAVELKTLKTRKTLTVGESIQL